MLIYISQLQFIYQPLDAGSHIGKNDAAHQRQADDKQLAQLPSERNRSKAAVNSKKGEPGRFKTGLGAM